MALMRGFVFWIFQTLKSPADQGIQTLSSNKSGNNAISWFFRSKSVLTVKNCLSKVLSA